MDERVNILLVDDQPNNLLALQSILAETEQNLVTAESGRKALKALLEHEFAVILLDVQMPELDGFSVIREIGAEQMPATVFVTAADRSHAASDTRPPGSLQTVSGEADAAPRPPQQWFWHRCRNGHRGRRPFRSGRNARRRA